MTSLLQTSVMRNFNNLSTKCGEISYCLQVNRRVYSLNCIYCPQMCLQWDKFINHMEQNHNDVLKLESAFDNESDKIQLEIDHVSDEICKNVPRNEAILSLDKRDKSDKFSLKDPLQEELSTNAVFVKGSFNTEVLECPQKETKSNDINNFQCVKFEIDRNDEIIDQDCDYINQNLDDDISLQSSTSYNNDVNNDANNHSSCDKTKLTELLIKYYKDNPMLWQTNLYEHKQFIKYKEVYKQITKLINKEMNLSLKPIQIRDKINKLRSTFRKEHEILAGLNKDVNKNFNSDDEMECGKFSTSSNEPQTTSWLYEKMSFLKNYIIDNRKQEKRKFCFHGNCVCYTQSCMTYPVAHENQRNEGAKALTNDNTCLPLPKYSLEANQHLVELYKSYPCLWNVDHIGFRFKEQRKESLQELLKVVNEEIDLKLSLDGLQRKLYSIRNAVTQEKHRQIECEKYGKEFSPRCKIYNEMLFLKDSVGPFKCEYCDQIFNGPDQYRVHKSSHDGSMPYSCPQCKKGFMNVGNCTVHLRRHTKDFKFECQECGKKFPTTTDLNVHKRQHTGEKPYFCDICGQSFRTWTNFDSHRRRHEKKKNHICEMCSKGFYERNKLKQHMKAHLNVRDKICNVCSKSFTCTKHLNQHKLIHAETKKYSCQICGKQFSQYAGLSNHIKSHGALSNECINNPVSVLHIEISRDPNLTEKRFRTPRMGK